jgi:hypothetical protein
MEFSRVRLIASAQGFTLYDGNNKKLAVAAVDLMIRPGVPPMVMAALAAGQVDVAESQAMFAIVDPQSGKPRVVRKIQWADGGETDFPAPEKAASGPKVSSEQKPAHLDPGRAPDPFVDAAERVALGLDKP